MDVAAVDGTTEGEGGIVISLNGGKPMLLAVLPALLPALLAALLPPPRPNAPP